jgi:hypothetical protein
MTDSYPGAELDAGIPHRARVGNYRLGGRDNLEVDESAPVGRKP